MDHLAHTPLSEAELTSEVLEGATIYGPEDETVGVVSHLHGVGLDAQAIIDVGGYLGIGTKAVAVPVRSLKFMRDENGSVHATTDWSKDDLFLLPEHQHL
jgi:hypothetical protein